MRLVTITTTMVPLKNFIKSNTALRNLLTPPVRLSRKLFPTGQHRRSDALAGLLSPVRGGSLIVEMPDFTGLFEIDVRSHILHRILTTRKYEPELAALVREKLDRNRDAIDVGANVGLFTILLATLVNPPNRVLAIEPTPGALKFLRLNLDRNKKSGNVLVFEGAASSYAGETNLNIIPGKEEYSSSGTLIHPGIEHELHTEVTVPSDTIDNLVEEFSLRPGFIKIDTEGSEHEVLLGCERTLSTHRPVILCEAWGQELLTKANKGSSDAVPNLLKSIGYSLSKDLAGETLAIPM